MVRYELNFRSWVLVLAFLAMAGWVLMLQARIGDVQAQLKSDETSMEVEVTEAPSLILSTPGRLCWEDEVRMYDGTCKALDDLTADQRLKEEGMTEGLAPAEWLQKLPGVAEVVVDAGGDIVDLVVDCDQETVDCDDEEA